MLFESNKGMIGRLQICAVISSMRQEAVSPLLQWPSQSFPSWRVPLFKPNFRQDNVPNNTHEGIAEKKLHSWVTKGCFSNIESQERRWRQCETTTAPGRMSPKVNEVPMMNGRYSFIQANTVSRDSSSRIIHCVHGYTVVGCKGNHWLPQKGSTFIRVSLPADYCNGGRRTHSQLNEWHHTLSAM